MYKKVRLFFKPPVYSYASTDETFIGTILNTVETKDPSQRGDAYWTLFKVFNAQHAPQIDQQFYPIAEPFIHFVCLAGDSIVDIITPNEPQITPIEWNIHNLLMLCREKIIPLITKHLPNAKVILYGPLAKENMVKYACLQLALTDRESISPTLLATIQEDIDDFSNTSLPRTIIDFATASEELKNDITQNGVIWKN